ncbi:hypothetical protein [Paramaledivibacter caminithermalis]|jgi:hypothetical protein|uniref:Uncharacterized protein n=1 Tax=Paramaledivibacter caminithermalis (strain DSM 15212 / CIP 107654 / DViRD3) TaxID=1121301 RepID=A0A1M6N679_PARC5|nr:hypothetical protein [Paramaledivibacter caminithermalis]SHJ91218.1 hypothetical protein SAMN02745912_01590 [Paramaledivibacter caminithermalis DSM 15212]
MPIRPIDMQVLMPKSQNISKISQDMANRSENLLQQADMKSKKIDKEKLKKVNTTEKKDKSLLKNNNSNENNKCIYNNEKRVKNRKNSKIDIKV